MSASLESQYENNGRSLYAIKYCHKNPSTHSLVSLFAMKVGHPVGLHLYAYYS